MNRPVLLILLVLLGAVASLSDHQVLSTLACAISGKAECSPEQPLSNPIENVNEGHSVLSDDKVLSLLAEALAHKEDVHAAQENEVVLDQENNNALNTLAQHLDTIENIVLGGSQESAGTLGYSDEEVSLHDNAAAPTDTNEKKPVGVVVGIVVASVGVPAVVLLAVIFILVVVVIIRKRNRPKDVHDALLD